MVHISENAAALIAKMTVKRGIPGGGLRIGIKAGGCSGLSYTFSWEGAPRDGDQVFEGAGGSKVFVAREFYADFQWDALGRRYQVPQGAQKLILAGYDRVEVPTGTKVRIFYLVRAPKSPPPPRFSLHLP